MAEAIREIELDRLPLVVGIDAKGNDLFRAVSQHAVSACLQRRTGVPAAARNIHKE
jgi:fumarate hydratase subunit beta